jgi:hypothetical protein
VFGDQARKKGRPAAVQAADEDEAMAIDLAAHRGEG